VVPVLNQITGGVENIEGQRIFPLTFSLYICYLFRKNFIIF
jgi:hypothetical protein